MNAREQIIQAAVDWNIRQRDAARKCKRLAEARRHQRNIDKLNADLRELAN
jgi:hypothetical protein